MPRRCPKLGSNVATSSPARCSGKFPKGRARGGHAELAPHHGRAPLPRALPLSRSCSSLIARPSSSVPRSLPALSLGPLSRPSPGCARTSPWPAGQACRRRVLAAPSSLESYRVRQHLPRRAPPLRLPFSGHRSRRSAVAAGAAAGAPPARAAGRPQAASGRAGKPRGCARAHGPSPPLPPPATRLLRPANSGLLRSSFKNREQGPWLRIRVLGGAFL